MHSFAVMRIDSKGIAEFREYLTEALGGTLDFRVVLDLPNGMFVRFKAASDADVQAALDDLRALPHVKEIHLVDSYELIRSLSAASED